MLIFTRALHVRGVSAIRFPGYPEAWNRLSIVWLRGGGLVQRQGARLPITLSVQRFDFYSKEHNSTLQLSISCMLLLPVEVLNSVMFPLHNCFR